VSLRNRIREASEEYNLRMSLSNRELDLTTLFDFNATFSTQQTLRNRVRAFKMDSVSQI